MADHVYNVTTEQLIDALRPFARAAAQMSRHKPETVILGEPLLGAGVIAPVSAFRKAEEIVFLYDVFFPKASNTSKETGHD